MRVLILDEQYCEPPFDGGSRSLWDLRRSLSELGHEAVISNNEALLEQGPWDMVMASRPMLAARVADRARRAARSHTVYLGHDLHHRRLAAADAALPGHPRPTAVMAALERHCWSVYDLSVYPNHEEVAVVQASGANARWFPYFRVDEVTAGCPAPHETVQPMTLLFVGGSSHTPNVTALRWFTEHVIPELPQVRMVVVGDWRPQLRQPLLGAGLDFVGTVSDQELRALSTGVDVHVAPLTAGAGLKSKVIDALASGVPLAASSVAMAGMPTPWDLAVRADDVHEWSRALDWIAARPSEVAAMTGRASKFVHDRHGRDAYLTATSALLEPVD